jgi:hypothetical protein
MPAGTGVIKRTHSIVREHLIYMPAGTGVIKRFLFKHELD